MGDPVPTDVKGTKRTVLAAVAAAAFVAGAGSQHLGGATLDAPATARAAGATLLVHAVRIEQPIQGGALTTEIFSTSVFVLPDAGTFKRSNQGKRCTGGSATAKGLATIEAVCKVGGGWLHVVELRPAADGGFGLEAYGSQLGADAGRVDLGRVACAVDVASDGAALVFQEAIACAEQVLDEP